MNLTPSPSPKMERGVEQQSFIPLLLLEKGLGDEVIKSFYGLELDLE